MFKNLMKSAIGACLIEHRIHLSRRTTTISTWRAVTSVRTNVNGPRLGASFFCIHRPPACNILHSILPTPTWITPHNNGVIVIRRAFLNTARLKGSGGADHVVFINNNRNYLLSTYACILVAVPFVLYNLYGMIASENSLEISPDGTSIDRSSVPFAIFSVVVFSVALGVTGFLIRRTLIRIDYSDRTRQFVGFRYNWRLAKKRIVFRPGQVTQIVDESNTWREVCGNVLIAGQRYYLPLKDYKSTYHYNLMLGLIEE